MLDTPLYSLSPTEKESVYEPAEDTFLLLDALQLDIERIRLLEPLICIEIGCGAGVVSSFVALNLTQPLVCLATDINSSATCCTAHTATLNGIRCLIHPIVMDLTDSFSDRLNGLVDLLILNPPYVPTNSDELIHGTSSSKLLSKAWAGGLNGRAVTDRFLSKVQHLLSAKGMFYLVAVKENDVDDLLQSVIGCDGSVVITRRCGAEELFILKFTKSCVQ